MSSRKTVNRISLADEFYTSSDVQSFGNAQGQLLDCMPLRLK